MGNKLPFKPPSFEEPAFNCPLCQAYAKQIWGRVMHPETSGNSRVGKIQLSQCSHCQQYSIWFSDSLVYPDVSLAEPPNDDLSEEIKADYLEAASILQKSPRGAAALLRLAIQKLCVQLGEPGKNINDDIGSLVKKGLPAKVQESLDALRVIGNESVHPGELDIKDDIPTATALFKLVNFIAEKMITEPKQIDEIYNKIPESKKEAISKRDQT